MLIFLMMITVISIFALSNTYIPYAWDTHNQEFYAEYGYSHDYYSYYHSGYIGDTPAYDGYDSHYDSYFGSYYEAQGYGYSDSDYYDFHIPFDGYIGIAPQPFNGGEGRQVMFNPNGGVTPAGHGVLYTTGNGTLGTMPFQPTNEGKHFMWWSLCPLGRDPLVTSHAGRFGPHSYVPAGGITLFAVWGYEIRFHGNGFAFPAGSPDVQSNPNSYVSRFIPYTWSFDEAEDFGVPTSFPNNPIRSMYMFWGWYSIAIPTANLSVPAPAPAFEIDRDYVVTGFRYVFARWRQHAHLVMFDMNHEDAGLMPGTADRPQRLYRWALNERSIADSGLGGDPLTGLGVAAAAPGTSVDGSPWDSLGAIPQEVHRQNRQRLWTPNVPPDNPAHIPRQNPDDSFHPLFTTPYYPGSGLVRGPGVGATGVNASAGTMNPRSAPAIYMGYQWEAFPDAWGLNASYQPRYTLEGWWTTEYGWAENLSGTINSRRFAPAAIANTHTSVSSAHHDSTANTHARPEGFPHGIARPAQDSAALSPAPPTGIVTEDMTVYAMWVYRVTFHLNGGHSHRGQGFSLEGNTDFNPDRSNFTNYRDILPCLPEAERTINQNGRRVRLNDGASGVTHQPIFAGMPVNPPERPGAIFNGWWDRQMDTICETHYLTCNDCVTRYCYPVAHHSAVEITGDTIINGSFTAFAHWLTPDGDINVTVIFNLNSYHIADRYTERAYGRAFWPTHRRDAAYNNPYNRLFLSRTAAGIPEVGIMPGATLTEWNHRYSFTHSLELANVRYEDRYERYILRQYTYNASITGHPLNLRMPRNPIRTGYVFVGWSVNEYMTPLLPNGNPRGIAANAAAAMSGDFFWLPGLVLNASVGLSPGDVLELFAIWAPAVEFIIDGNGNTGPLAPTPGGNARVTNALPPGTLATEIVRVMPIGFTPTELMNSARWGSVSAGMLWLGNKYTMNNNTEGNMLARHFTRLNHHPLHPATGFNSSTNEYSQLPGNVFNTDQGASVLDGQVVGGNTRFSAAFFAAPSSNMYSFRPDENGDLSIRYLRVYTQWGATLTFHGNLTGGGSGPVRTANVATGRTVNSLMDPATRHLNTPTVQSIWPPGPVIGSGTWAGTSCDPANPGGGTRGGWPRDPFLESPSRNFDLEHGDWYALFAGPRADGRTLRGWHRNPDGRCICETTPAPCPWDYDHDYGWVDADTPIIGTTAIYAIWDNYVHFLPGLGGDAVNMAPVGALQRTIPNGLLTPPPGIPTWGNTSFLGWFDTPYFDRLDPNQTGAFNFAVQPINTARRFYAVFVGNVIFDPRFPGWDNGGYLYNLGPNATPVYEPWEHAVGDYIRIRHYNPDTGVMEFRPQRPGWPSNHFTGEWFGIVEDGDYLDPADRLWFRPPTHPDGPDGQIPGNMTLYPVWRSQVTFRAGHERGRLDNLTTSTDVIRMVPELLPISSMPTGRGVPVAVSANCPSDWTSDPGLKHIGWRKIDVYGRPLILNNNNNFVLAGPNDTIPLWSCADVGDFRVTGPNYYFEAMWQLRLDFYKVSAVESDEFPLGYYHLEGGRFALDRYFPGVGPGTGWVQVYPPLPADPNDPVPFVVSDADGKVVMGTLPAPGLMLPQRNDWPCAQDNCSSPNCSNSGCGILTFRLREVLAPAEHITPAGYWLVTISRYLGVLPSFNANAIPYLFRDTLTFQNVNVDGDTWDGWGGIRQFVRNIPYDFDFWKTNMAGNRLEGARFYMFEFNGPGTPPDVMITSAMVGDGAGQWTQIGYRISSLSDNAPMTFRLLPGPYYQLIEAIPPAGHQMPMGQWRIRVNSATPATAHPTLAVSDIGFTPMPSILRMIPPNFPFVPQTYVIHNRADFNLPLTGGAGMQLPLAFAGTLLLSTAAVLFIVIKKRRLLAYDAGGHFTKDGVAYWFRRLR
ncbi:MAG: hypothetical protein FWE42_04485 [Defluviitaleaceae bacterium]|nr:hypothetical protein [Defluviitaleaceae bacterium]